jgi:tetrahydromethanopterin S-methyltransferase subunit F
MRRSLESDAIIAIVNGDPSMRKAQGRVEESRGKVHFITGHKRLA